MNDFIFQSYTLSVLLPASLAALSKHKPDRAKALASQIASKAYFAGEIAGLRLASRRGNPILLTLLSRILYDVFVPR